MRRPKNSIENDYYNKKAVYRREEKFMTRNCSHKAIKKSTLSVDDDAIIFSVRDNYDSNQFFHFY